MSKTPDLIQVGEMAVGFSENVLPDTRDLNGKEMKLCFEDGSAIEYRFLSENRLFWKTSVDSKTAEEGEETYRATCPRKGIYFVDYIKNSLLNTTISLVLDFEKEIATFLTGSLPSEQEAREDKLKRVAAGLPQTAVTAVFKNASINRAFDNKTAHHKPSTDMIGKRIKYIYSANDSYEHIYLNEGCYTWHCLSGIEKGMADTDLCHHFKIAEELYLFVWREKLVPTLGVVIINLREMKTTGKIFGYESDDFGKLISFPVGAYAEFANVTKYD